MGYIIVIAQMARDLGCSKQTLYSSYALYLNCHKSPALCYNYDIIGVCICSVILTHISITFEPTHADYC